MEVMIQCLWRGNTGGGGYCGTNIEVFNGFVVGNDPIFDILPT